MSKNPLRRLSEQVLLTSMRPPLTERLQARDDIDVAGKRILLTGASSGIGEAAAEKFAAKGATVIAVARRQELLDDLVGRISAKGGDARAHAVDLSDLDAIDELVATVERDLGGVDILINNAGRSIRRPLAESLDRWHDVERTMTLNYYSPLRLIRGLAPGMRERRDGHIINVATWGVMNESSPLFAVYNASKAGAGRGQPGHRDRMGLRRRSFHHAVLPVGEDPDDRPHPCLRRTARAVGRRGRRLDADRGAHPAGTDRATDGGDRQSTQHRGTRSGRRRHEKATGPTGLITAW